MDIRKISAIKKGDEVIGNRVRVKVVKNKIAPPFKTAEFDIMFGEGISKYGELVDYGVKLDIIDKSGAWFSYKDVKLGQGREKVKETFKEDPVLASKIENEIKEAMGISQVMDIPENEINEEDNE